ncbi:signal peptidase I [Paenibacillus sp. SYP-B3998]|uniref:Signal peptidase I n=1 Tax=Paenibacillus sp. SYP-B3998 TaxID=2678564 RepID=A0A6G3ZTJ3_9BACL|nr:signal peptidase I [Paenibacillus sp. SYP-B3998]NEW05523.1 signal peptidase I [Paenibacillus sp. SYP-B3998]
MEQKDQEQPIQESGSSSTVAVTKSTKNETWEWIKALVIAGVLVIIIRWFLFSPFIVDGDSMRPNFFTGERLIVNKIVYDIRTPKRGEVIVFHAPEGKDYIKRVIGLPGETVKVDGDKVYINGQEIDQAFIKEAVEQAAKEGHAYNTLANFPETKIPENEVFAMGDNRSNSKDSRDKRVGFVPFDKIVGRAEVIFWPVNKISFIHF